MRFILVILISFSCIFQSLSQGTCNTALPFCTGTNYVFPASTNTPAPTGANFGCLGTQPNPAFYFMEIDNPGNITINIQGLGVNGGTNDIDFICWGPFTNPATMCNQLTAGNIEDCSYSPTWNEFCQINGASSGDYYVLLITNYSNQACNINFSQTGGNATTNCCILGGDAGGDNSIDVCESDPNFNMVDELNGNPDLGGTWYDLNNNIVSNTFNPNTNNSGIYTYIVNGSSSACPDDTAYLTINVNTLPVITFPNLNDVCDFDSPINLNASPVGGAYSGIGVNNNIFTPNTNNIGSNTITYTYTDQNGCTNSLSQNINVNETPFVTASTINVSCNGFSDGSATLNITGGTAPYIQDWGVFNPSSLSAGIYGFTVTDINGCVFSDSTTIFEPAVFSAAVNSNDITCFGYNNGFATIDILGGTTPPGTTSILTYCNSSPGSSNYSNIENVLLNGDNFNISNNTSGICDSYEDYTNQYADITEGQSYTVSVNLGDCSGFNFQSGGKVYIDWNIDGDFLDPSEEIGTIPYGLNSSTIINFTVPYTGVYGATRMRVVSQFSSISTNSTSSCDVGLFSPPSSYAEPWYGATEDYSIVIHSSTGNANILWSNGSTLDSIYGLSPGNYSVTITNNNGCVLNDFITINEPSSLNATTISTPVTCYGNNDGGIILNLIGGTTDYTISAAGYNQTLTNGVSVFSIPNLLSSGTYPYTVVDGNGCILTDSVIITSPSPISTIENIQNVSCNGGNDGSVSLIISGGTPSFIEDWNGLNSDSLSAGVYNYSITDINGCIYNDSIIIQQPILLSSTFTQVNASTCLATDGSIDVTIIGGTAPYSYYWTDGLGFNSSSEDLYNLSSGTYNLTVTDINGCIESISVVITEPSPPILSFTQNNVSCFGYNDGSVDLSVIGGSSPYNYIWSNNETSQDINNLVAGSYNVNVTDINGCNETISINITEPSAPTISNNVSNVDCFNNNTGSIDLNVLGANPPYSYLWNNNTTTQDLINLTAGIYSCTITDGNNCSYYEQITVSEPAILTTNPTISDVDCFGNNTGFSHLNITGGTSPYIEDWNGFNPNALSAGSYNYTVTDVNGCVYQSTIIITQPNELLVNENTSNATCGGYTDGNATLYIVGGTSPYIEDWNGFNPNALSAGSYNYTVTDVNGCVFSSTISILEPPSMQIVVDTFRTSCFGSNDGSAIVTVSGGAGPPYVQDWGSYNPSSLSAGTYNFTISDANNCIAQNQAVITEPGDIQITEVIQNVSCYGLSDGQAFLQISGGTPPYIENWNGINNTTLSQGTYSYIITDNNNCTKNQFLTINEPNKLKINATIIDANCFNSNDGQILLNINGGTPPYSQNWGVFNPYALSAGSYNFIITDINGCLFDSVAIVEQANQISIDLDLTSPICRGDTSYLSINILNPNNNLFSLEINSILDTNIYLIDSSGHLIPQGSLIGLTPEQNTTITISKITDENGCVTQPNISKSIIVNQLPLLEIQTENVCISEDPIILDGIPIGGNFYINNNLINILYPEELGEGSHLIKYVYTEAVTGCNNSIIDTVNLFPNPKASFFFSPQPTDINDPNIYFSINDKDIINSYWNLGDGSIIIDSMNFWHEYQDTGLYSVELIVYNEYGCTDTSKFELKINPVYEIFIPTSFTPNEDGINDVFQPSVMASNEYTLIIYNRWGEIVFKGINEGWDGKSKNRFVEDGIYTYVIIVNDFKDKLFKYTGNLLLIK